MTEDTQGRRRGGVDAAGRKNLDFVSWPSAAVPRSIA